MDSKLAQKLRSKWPFGNPFKAHNQDHTDVPPMCSFFGWKPKWLQPFNNMKAFMICLVVSDIFKGIFQSNFSVMIPSITRRFGFNSESVGTVKAMSDVSHLLVALFIAHYGGASHRPRWMACGLLLVSLGILLMAAPEIIFPLPNLSSLRATVSSSTGEHVQDQMCDASRNVSGLPVVYEDCTKPKTDHINPMIVFGVAEFIIGLGATTTRILGLPFVDDNVTAKNSPIYFAISFSGFVFGPLIGIALSSYFTTIFFDFTVPSFNSSDPRWVAAWYLGFLVSGLGVCFVALLLSCFPSKIRNKNTAAPPITDPAKIKMDGNSIRRLSMAIEEPDQPQDQKTVASVTLRDLPRSLKNLLTNKVYVISLLNYLLSSFVLAGYMSFMQMFLRHQYQLPQSISSSAGGIPPILAGLVGVFFGGFVIRRWKLRPSSVATMMAISSLIGAGCYLGVIAMGCDTQAIVGLDNENIPFNSTTSVANTCHVDTSCNCQKWQFVPVCSLKTNTTYLSPCYAGCRSFKKLNNTSGKDSTKEYYKCSCARHALVDSYTTRARQNWPGVEGMTANSTTPQSDRLNDEFEGKTVSGMCKPNCIQSFIGYVVLMCVAKFFMGIPMSGILMLQFRIVEKHEKSMANAVTTVVTSGLGMLPAPIVAGKLIDSACLLWERSPCGHHGACWIYNMDSFRFRLHALVGVARLISVFLELAVAYYVKDITFDRVADERELAAGRKAALLVATSTVNLVESEELDQKIQLHTESADHATTANTKKGPVRFSA